MAKLTAPLLSFGSRGQIGKTMVTANWRGISYARQYTIPANPRTLSQQVTRNIFRTINGYYRILPAEGRAPWLAASVGRSFTDRNKLIAENMPLLHGESDMQTFIASPGSLGGGPLDDVDASTGSGSGEIDVTATAPAAPTGWSLTKVVCLAFPDQPPTETFQGPVAVDEDETAPYAVTLDGLPAATLCVVNAWPIWERPDGKLAYGPSLITTATTGA